MGWGGGRREWEEKREEKLQSGCKMNKQIKIKEQKHQPVLRGFLTGDMGLVEEVTVSRFVHISEDGTRDAVV